MLISVVIIIFTYSQKVYKLKLTKHDVDHNRGMFISKQLLDACTDKLGLVSAARKLFLSDGTQVTHPRQLPRDVDVYVSCGEGFRDPFAAIQGIDYRLRLN